MSLHTKLIVFIGLVASLEASIFHFSHPPDGGPECLTLCVQPVLAYFLDIQVKDFIVQDHIMKSTSSQLNCINRITLVIMKDDVTSTILDDP